jgi:hypothetical protein
MSFEDELFKQSLDAFGMVQETRCQTPGWSLALQRDYSVASPHFGSASLTLQAISARQKRLLQLNANSHNIGVHAVRFLLWRRTISDLSTWLRFPLVDMVKSWMPAYICRTKVEFSLCGTVTLKVLDSATVVQLLLFIDT